MMKLFKGCLTKVILIAVLILGAGYYVYVNYGNNIKESLKKEALSWLTSNLDDKLSELDDTTAEQMKMELEKYLNELSKKDLSEAMSEIDKVSEYFDMVLRDKQINTAEIEKLKKMMRTNEE